jgi:hypothetical protein
LWVIVNRQRSTKVKIPVPKPIPKQAISCSRKVTVTDSQKFLQATT